MSLGTSEKSPTAAAMTANFLSLWPKFLQLGHKSALPTFPVQDDWENVEAALLSSQK